MDAFGRFLDGYHNVHTQLWDLLRARTLAALDHHTGLKAAIDAESGIERRAAYVRETFLASIGGVPDTAGAPLNARVVGAIERGGYTIEKVIYESLPQAYVTGLLYVPDHHDMPLPAVLFVCGHAREAKAYPEYQRVCHDLAQQGFVVFAIDPTGQGERIAIRDPETGEMPLGWGTTEHTYQGQQCIFTGTDISRYFLCDALRALDYLETRPEVDAARLGITGNSGGGTQTTLVCMSGEPRIKAAMPCTYVTSREHYFITGQPQDAEQIQFAMTANGINYDDMFYPFVPRPLRIGAVASDFFSPEGTDLTVQRLRRVYAQFGAEDRIDRVMAPGLHAYNKGLREAAVEFFSKHLQGRAVSFTSAEDEAIETLPEEALFCTPKGHVRTEFPDARTPYHLNLETIPKRAAGRSAIDLRYAVTEGLHIRERLDSPCAMYPRTLKTLDVNGVSAQCMYFRSEPGIMLSGALLRRDPDAPAQRVTLYLAPGGTRGLEDKAAQAAALLEAGEAVYVADVRLEGALEPFLVNGYSSETPRFPGTFFDQYGWQAFCAYCLGESLLGMRVFDVLRTAAMLRGHERVAEVSVWGTGLEQAIWAYLGGALDPAIARTRADGLIASFEAIVRTERYRTDITPTLVSHGLLQQFDLPELRPLFDGRSLETTPADVALT